MSLSLNRRFSAPWFHFGMALGLGLALPLAAAVVSSTLSQVLWGFDDQPFGAMFLGLAVGVVLAVALVVGVSTLVTDRKIALAGRVLCVVLAAELLVLPLGWAGTHYVERVNTKGLLGR